MTAAVLTESAALQAALAAEQAAVYGYGVAGSYLTDGDRTHALTDLHTHQVLRDRLAQLVAATDEVPTGAQPAYELPFAVTNATTARQLAAAVEEGCAGAAWDLVAAGAPGGASRALAITLLTDAALRATRWAARQALPGQPPPAAAS